jgi:putative acetyltransferase
MTQSGHWHEAVSRARFSFVEAVSVSGTQVIRKYKEADAEAIVDIWFAASLVATPFLSDEFLAEERCNILSMWLPKAETWVFEVDDTVSGFISLIGNEVGAIFVHPDSQGRGSGRALMNHAANLRDELFLDVFKENAVGRRFYDRYGFQFQSEHVHEPTGQTQLRLVYTPNKNTP